MTKIDFLLSGANIIISLLDLKQQLLTGTRNSNSYFAKHKNVERVPLGRSSKEFRESPGSDEFYINPLLRVNTPDPGVTRLVDGSGWALVSTTNNASRADNSSAFPIYFSKDLVNWQLQSWVFTPTNWPVWAYGSMWAPELHHVNGRYIVYFTGANRNEILNCGAAVALTSDPFGAYEDIGQPLVVDESAIAGALDPHYFKDPVTKKHYLLWKEDNPLALQTSVINIRELKPEGTSFDGDSRTILRSNLSGERLVVEAPWMMYKDGYYYLFYSSGWFHEAKYHMRVAKGKRALGPFIKRNLPVLDNDWEKLSKGENSTFLGPGHASVVSMGDDWWVIYHAWVYGRVDKEPGRQLLLDKILWQSGWPIVGSPSVSWQHKPEVNRLKL
eukprot:GFUD01004329.1.p1 GENE.GFUD01004329.1~~GFUD01004329.1.p1  ORF type:complete len:386 (+),score=57.74 GFUD01004329.1:247-1404(+)